MSAHGSQVTGKADLSNEARSDQHQHKVTDTPLQQVDAQKHSQTNVLGAADLGCLDLP